MPDSARITISQFRTKDHESLHSSSFYKETYINTLILKLMGLVAFRNQSLHCLKTRLLCIWFHFCYNFLNSIYVCVFIKDALKFKYNIELISEMIILICYQIRFIIFYLHRDELASLLNFAENLWEQLQPVEQKFVIKFITKSKIMISIYLGICILLYGCFTILDQLVLSTTNENKTATRDLPFSFYVTLQDNLTFTIMFVVQCFITSGLVFTNNGVDTIGILLIMIACGYFRTLQHRLQNISMNYDTKVGTKDFVNTVLTCIKHHQIIIEYCNRVQIIMNPVFVTQLVASTYIMSIVALNLVSDNSNKSKDIVILFLLLIQLFYLESSPEILLNESKAVANAAFIMPPFGYKDRQVNKLLYILLMRTQRPVQLKAAGYFKLSLESFGMLISDVVSFFTVFHNL